jgi:hypothetical protein
MIEAQTSVGSRRRAGALADDELNLFASTRVKFAMRNVQFSFILFISDFSRRLDSTAYKMVRAHTMSSAQNTLSSMLSRL